MIRLLLKEEFWANLKTPINYEAGCLFHIPYEQLRLKIGATEPNRDLRGEDDPPCPVSRWYGDVCGVPFLLDFYHGHPHGEVVIIWHGEQGRGRNAVRNAFITWGERWQEAPLS